MGFGVILEFSVLGRFALFCVVLLCFESVWLCFEWF